jgi:hypothetical protein
MPLSSEEEKWIHDAIWKNETPTKCLRCNSPFHRTRICPLPEGDKDAFKYGDASRIADSAAAERFWKDEKTKWETSESLGSKPDQEHPIQSGPSDKKNKDAGPKGGHQVPTKQTSDKPTAKKTPIANPKIGTILISTVVNNAPSPVPSNISSGVPDAGSVHLGPPAQRKYGEIEVLTNYVRVKKIPKNLHVYSLAFSRPNTDSATAGRIEYKKRREIESAFKALLESGRIGLPADGISYATDFRDLWCTSLLFAGAVGTVLPIDNLQYTQLNGKTVNDLRANLTYTGSLNNIEMKFRQDSLAALHNCIQALNANVAESIRRNGRESGTPLTQVGANKFFLDEGFINICGLRAARGYYTSIRPGKADTLLNINAATSAFLPPVLVSEFIRNVRRRPARGSLRYIEKLLKGATVKIQYIRQNFQEDLDAGIDANTDENRLKIFKQFGLRADSQKFFALKERKKGDKGKQIDPRDRNGTSVFDHFKNGTNFLQAVTSRKKC